MKTAATNWVETELEWLLYQLWSKSQAKPHRFDFSITDTVVLRHGAPKAWYYSNEEGAIRVKKSHERLHYASIYEQFATMSPPAVVTNQQVPICTSYLYQPQENLNRIALTLGYHFAGDFEALVAEYEQSTDQDQTKPQILQLYAHSGDRQNTIYKALWSPSSLNILAFTNKADANDQAYSREERLVTCEDETIGLFTTQKFLEVESKEFKRISLAMGQIYSHLRRNSSNALLGGNFFFKVSPETFYPVLIFATQLKTKQPTMVLNSNLKMAICFKGDLPRPTFPKQGQSKSTLSENRFSQLHQRLLIKQSKQSTSKGGSAKLQQSSRRASSQEKESSADRKNSIQKGEYSLPTGQSSERPETMLQSSSVLSGLTSSNPYSNKPETSCPLTASDLEKPSRGQQTPTPEHQQLIVLKPAFKSSRVLAQPTQAQKKYMRSIKRALRKELESKVKNFSHNPPSVASLSSLAGGSASGPYSFEIPSNTATSGGKPQWRRVVRPASAKPPTTYLPKHSSLNPSSQSKQQAKSQRKERDLSQLRPRSAAIRVANSLLRRQKQFPQTTVSRSAVAMKKLPQSSSAVELQPKFRYTPSQNDLAVNLYLDASRRRVVMPQPNVTVNTFLVIGKNGVNVSSVKIPTKARQTLLQQSQRSRAKRLPPVQEEEAPRAINTVQKRAIQKRNEPQIRSKSKRSAISRTSCTLQHVSELVSDQASFLDLPDHMDDTGDQGDVESSSEQQLPKSFQLAMSEPLVREQQYP